MNQSLNATVSLAMAVLSMASAAAAPHEFDCMIEPVQTVEVRSPVSGLLQRVHARRGESIRMGQLLVTIDSSVEQSAAATARFRAQAQGAVLSASSKVAAAREKSRRMNELHEEEFVSVQARDDAAAELKLAETELHTANEGSQLARLEHQQSLDQLNRRTMYSPFDGVVMDQYLYPGALVDGGEGKRPILKIAQTHPLAVQAILPYRLFPQLKIGMAAVVVPEAPFTRNIAARIDTVDRVIDSAAGTFGIVAKIDNGKQLIPAGVRCKLRIQLPG